jgi:hypothetical protein
MDRGDNVMIRGRALGHIVAGAVAAFVVAMLFTGGVPVTVPADASTHDVNVGQRYSADTGDGVAARPSAPLAVPVTMLTPASRAQAAAPSLHCEGGGGHWICRLVNAVPISWWVNGKRVPAFDMLPYASGRCALNERVGVKVYFYTEQLGELGRSVWCPAHMP